MINMRNNIKISSLQIGFLSFFLSQVAFFPLISKLLFNRVKQDIWISIIIGFILGLVILKLFLKFEEKLEYKNIIEFNLHKYGKIIGNILNMVIVIGVMLAVISLFSKFCIFINVNYLSNIPILFIQITFILVVVYAETKGIQTIVRTSQILGILSIILFVCSILLNAYNFNFSNIFPVMENDIANIFVSSIYYAFSSILPIFLLSIFPKDIVRDNKKYNKSIVWGYIFSSIVTFTILVTTLLVLGKHLIISFEYPEYISFKQIQYFYFIERFENIFSMIWFFNFFIFLALSIHFIYNYIKLTFSLKKNHSFILLLISTVIILITNIVIFLK